MNNKQKEESVTLEILEAIEEQSDVTQRHLAHRTGVALGLANLYLKRCVRKGLVKIQQVPANRYLYYLTPKGFAEKSRLTAQFLSSSFAFYRKAGDSCSEAFTVCKQRKWKNILLCGASELAEIAALRAIEHGIRIVGVYDPKIDQKEFLNKKVFKSIKDCDAFDGCLLTDLNDPATSLTELTRLVKSEQIITPNILGLKFNR